MKEKLIHYLIKSFLKFQQFFQNLKNQIPLILNC